MCFLTGLNGGTTGSGHLEVHCGLGPGFGSRLDAATPFGYIDTQTNQVLNGGKSVPLSPVDVVARAGDRSAKISFAASLYDGGNPIIGYKVTSSPGGITATGVPSPITVQGLADGTPYTFTVTAINVFGPSRPSAPSNSVTPTSALTMSACPAGEAGTPPNCRASTSTRKCVVPRLRGRTLRSARRMLSHAHCSLGHVRRPHRRHQHRHRRSLRSFRRRHHHRRRSGAWRIVDQSPRPGTSRHSGTPVSVSLKWHAR
jgi:Fibronectin type III domain